MHLQVVLSFVRQHMLHVADIQFDQIQRQFFVRLSLSFENYQTLPRFDKKKWL